MIFNLFSNIAQSSGELQILQNNYWKKLILSAPCIYNMEQTVIDPVAKLLEDIKNRKIEVIVPTKRDIIPTIWNNKKLKKSVDVIINPGKDVLVNPTKINWEVGKVSNFLGKQKSAKFGTDQHKAIFNKLKMIPAYIVVTNTNEIIMAMSRDSQYNNVFNWIYRKYFDSSIVNEDKGPISIALFFLNKEDAILYMQSLGGKSDVNLLEKSKIRIQSTTLGHFYYLSKTFLIGQQARIIADLGEMEKVIFSHLPSKLQNPNIKQNYSNNGFIGTPIYTINVTSRKNAYKQQNLEISKKILKPYINSIFFRLEDAYLAWEKICETNKNAKLEIRPNIEIYNIENYLLDLEEIPTELVEEINFRPSLTSIKNAEKQVKLVLENTEENEEESSSSEVKKNILGALRYEKLISFYKGTLWLFTSDNLPTEKNAW